MQIYSEKFPFSRNIRDNFIGTELAVIFLQFYHRCQIKFFNDKHLITFLEMIKILMLRFKIVNFSSIGWLSDLSRPPASTQKVDLTIPTLEKLNFYFGFFFLNSLESDFSIEIEVKNAKWPYWQNGSLNYFKIH